MKTMKKIKHYYSSYMQTYDDGLSRDDLLKFYSKTGVELHVERVKVTHNFTNGSYEELEEVAYTWEYVEKENLPIWFTYIGSVDEEIGD